MFYVSCIHRHIHCSQNMLICYKVCFMVPYKTHILCRKFSTLNPRFLMQIVKRRPRKENHNSSANRNFKSFTKRRIEHPRSGLVWDRVLQFYQLCAFMLGLFMCELCLFVSFCNPCLGLTKLFNAPLDLLILCLLSSWARTREPEGRGFWFAHQKKF